MSDRFREAPPTPLAANRKIEGQRIGVSQGPRNAEGVLHDKVDEEWNIRDRDRVTLEGHIRELRRGIVSPVSY